MIKSEKSKSELAKNLKNPDQLVVSASIDILRDTEPFEGAISQLADYYDICSDKSVKITIANFFNDIKDTQAKKEILASIKSSKNDETRAMLITSCWQSGLDYSENIDSFIDFFIDNSFDIAFECLTVIEQSVEHLDLAKRNEIIRIIKDKASNQPTDKVALVNELINVLS